MSDEISVMRRAWLRVANTTTLFRCNTGKAWAAGGKAQRRPDGSVLLPNARPIALGLSMPNGDPVVGTHDLIGWTSLVITPAMVGKRVAVFTSADAKNSSGGRQRPEQVTWKDNVQRAGGIAGFFSSPEGAEQIIADYIKNLEHGQQ
jgi:hypothetical protein